MKENKPLHIFQAYGVELEYMIVDKNTLSIKPIADELIRAASGSYVDEFENGSVTWSNELVRHLIELKCTRPTADLWQLGQDFAANVRQINHLLSAFDAKLMPTAAHPWMNPMEETQLWPYGNKEIYETYDRIFNCKGHGWANLQSTHINLPFANDEEFARLHAAIRVLMPIMPALTASSPILDGQFSGFLDKRLDYYRRNQERIPEICGMVIPEQAFSEADYQRMVYDPITTAKAPHDPEGILEAVWLNSRGAIARFDRGSVEIRILDIQESPLADLALLNLIIHVLRLLADEKLCSMATQQQQPEDKLAVLLFRVARQAEGTLVDDEAYLSLLQWHNGPVEAHQLWQHLYQRALAAYPVALAPWKTTIEHILQSGSLSSRILRHCDGIYSRENLKLVYSELCDCLQENDTFETWQPAVSS
jgi:carboxylate-amine ligase